MNEWGIPKHFLNRKKMFMKKLDDAIKRGLVDFDIVKLLLKMNKLPVLYTTSSCSGRIFIVDVPVMGRKDMTIKVAKWHREVRLDELMKAILDYNPKGILWLKVEGMIIAFAVYNVEWASFFIRLARLFGYKDSGIRSISPRGDYIIMDVTSTEKLHIPIGFKLKGILFSEEDLNRILNIANWLLRRTKIKLYIWEKIIDKLIDLFEGKMINPNEIDFKMFDDILKLKSRLLREEDAPKW